MFPNLCAVSVALVMAFSLPQNEALAHAANSEKVEKVTLGFEYTVQSEILGEERQIFVNLPKGYAQDTDERYSVLYVLDGETHFKMASGIVDWLSGAAAQMPRTIVVGVANTPDPRTRARDFTRNPQAGGSNDGVNNFRTFLRDELIPYIDENFRTHPFRILSAHSLAGLFTIDTMITDTNLFKGYIAISPYFIADASDTGLNARVSQYLENRESLQVTLYSSLGGNEGNLKPEFDKFQNTLQSAKIDGLAFETSLLDSQTHMATPPVSLHLALQYIFADLTTAPSTELMAGGVEAISAHFEDLSKNKYGFEVSAQSAISALAVSHQQNGNIAEATNVLIENVKLYPNSINAHINLLRLYAGTRQFAKAVEAGKRALPVAQKQNPQLAQALAGQLQQLQAAADASRNK